MLIVEIWFKDQCVVLWIDSVWCLCPNRLYKCDKYCETTICNPAENERAKTQQQMLWIYWECIGLNIENYKDVYWYVMDFWQMETKEDH